MASLASPQRSFSSSSTATTTPGRRSGWAGRSGCSIARSGSSPVILMALKANAALRRAQGRFDDAIVVAEAVIMENPGEPWAYKEIGLSTLFLGKPEQALEWFAKA